MPMPNADLPNADLPSVDPPDVDPPDAARTPARLSPAAVATPAGVDLLLPLATPRGVLELFVAACNVGQCDCETSFVSRIDGVELTEEPGQLRVQITGPLTPAEVLAEMASSAPALSPPGS